MDDFCASGSSTHTSIDKARDAPPAKEFAAHRIERRLRDLIALPNVAVKLTELSPGCASFVLHRQPIHEELIYVLAGRPTLVMGNAELTLRPGDCYEFKARHGRAHQLVNRSAEKAVYLEIGDRGVGGVAGGGSMSRMHEILA